MLAPFFYSKSSPTTRHSKPSSFPSFSLKFCAQCESTIRIRVLHQSIATFCTGRIKPDIPPNHSKDLFESHIKDYFQNDRDNINSSHPPKKLNNNEIPQKKQKKIGMRIPQVKLYGNAGSIFKLRLFSPQF